MVYLWLLINIFIIFGMITWSLLHDTNGLAVQIATLFSQTAFVLILLNLNMYFIFLIIRKSKIRKVKLTLAKISRKIMKLHVPIAISAASLICIHIALIVLNIPLDLTDIKILSGLIAAAMLVLTILAGFFRSKKASGKRRKAHIITAFIFFLIAFIHIFSSF